ncbi:MAG: DUF1648 domain-containing protein [Ginsengibacter sp.]
MANPKIKIDPLPSDKLADFLSLGLLIFSWIFLLAIYTGMPETVPIHLNGVGKADGFSNKITLFIDPLISTIIYTLLTYLNKYPHIYNYPTVINERNAAQYYTIGSRMIRYLKLSVMIVLLLVQLELFAIAKDVKINLGVWSLIIPLLIIQGPVIYYLKDIFNKKNLIGA